MGSKKLTFYDYFATNMKALGLPAPRGWFESQATAVALITAIAKFVKDNGAGQNLRHFLSLGHTIAAGLAGGAAVATSAAILEAMVVVGGVSAASYLGACIGSLAVASGKVLANGISASNNGSYDYEVVARTCSRHGIPMVDCLKEPFNRPFPGRYLNWVPRHAGRF